MITRKEYLIKMKSLFTILKWMCLIILLFFLLIFLASINNEVKKEYAVIIQNPSNKHEYTTMIISSFSDCHLNGTVNNETIIVCGILEK